MTDGLMLPPGGGRVISSSMTLKAGREQSAVWSVFEAEVEPGFDVGAHLHRETEEVFYVLEGELDLLAFQPSGPVGGDWRTWESDTGAKVVRGGPGSFMSVPTGCPHAFHNPGTETARLLFLVSPAGHEDYLERLGELLSRPGPPDPEAVTALRAQYDTYQLTPLTARR